MEIYISRDGQRFGPYSLSEVQADLDAGNIVGTDLAWHEAAPGWIPISQISGLTIPRRRMPPPPPTTSTGTPQKPASVGELVVIIILTLLFPLIGLVLGIMRVTKPEKRNEGWILLGISIFIMLFYVVLMFK